MNEPGESSPSCCAPRRTSFDPDRGEGGSAAAEPTSGEQAPEPDLVSIPAGTFQMGTVDPRGYPADGEGPVHDVELSSFAIAPVCVTNDAFAAFVDATGYRTDSDRYGASFVFGGLLPDDFPPTRGVAAAPWWREVEGATWRHPEGPQSSVEGRGNHPVVHVSWQDALAYCEWVGARLPTEAEWECAARGGASGEHFPWGSELTPDDEHRMNVFQGVFPADNTADDGWLGTCPVATFPANGFGLFEMTGNVWEWCMDWFDPGTYQHAPRVDPAGPPGGTARVMRGGSYLCHESYCWRYRVDARSANTPDSAAGNIGFRIVR